MDKSADLVAMAKSPRNEGSETDIDMSTDLAWEQWGQLEPYYGVITNPKFKMSEIDENSKLQFFESGRIHVEGVLRNIRQQIAPGFAPRTVLDFGCGVGRLVIPFAKLAQEVVGLDISRTMLQEAAKNCDANGLSNVRLELSDDSLSALKPRMFDLVHSAIVFQHIPTERGKLIFRRLLDCIAPGGVGAIQLLYSKAIYSSTNGIAPVVPVASKSRWLQRTRTAENKAPQSGLTPEMQMNPYNMNELLFFMQSRGVQQFFSRFTNHGGELGLWVYFQLF